MKKELIRITRMLLKAGVTKDFIRKAVKKHVFAFYELSFSTKSRVYVDYRRITKVKKSCVSTGILLLMPTAETAILLDPDDNTMCVNISD